VPLVFTQDNSQANCHPAQEFQKRKKEVEQDKACLSLSGLDLGDSLGAEDRELLLGLVELGRLGLALDLELLEGILMLPANLEGRGEHEHKHGRMDRAPSQSTEFS